MERARRDERLFERFLWRPRPDALLDEALDDLRACSHRSRRAIARDARLGAVQTKAGAEPQRPHWTPSRVVAKRTLARRPTGDAEINVILDEMRGESAGANQLIDRISTDTDPG